LFRDAIERENTSSLAWRIEHDEQIERILYRFNTAGRIEALTEKEGRFIHRQVSLDSLRNRILADAREANISPTAWQKEASLSRLAEESAPPRPTPTKSQSAATATPTSPNQYSRRTLMLRCGSLHRRLPQGGIGKTTYGSLGIFTYDL
jgi:hypothetical protein